MGRRCRSYRHTQETEYAYNIAYIGAPVYSYSLRQGISDGFLAPFKVIEVHLDIDVEGYRPPRGETDKHGQLIDDRLCNLRFERAVHDLQGALYDQTSGRRGRGSVRLTPPEAIGQHCIATAMQE